MDSALDTLSSTVLGALVVVLGIACAWLARKLSEVQEARVADAKKVSDTQLEREEKWLTVLGDLTGAIERLSAAPPGRQR